MEKPVVFSELTKTHFDDFGKNAEKVITPDMEQAIQLISQTGASCYEWASLKPFIMHKMDQALETLNQENPDIPTFKEHKLKLLTDLNGFEGIPFTIQRMCELIINPRSMYKSTRKFLWALERVVSITTTVQAVVPQQHPINAPPEEESSIENNEEEEELQQQPPEQVPEQVPEQLQEQVPEQLQPFGDSTIEANGISTINHVTSSGTLTLNNSTL